MDVKESARLIYVLHADYGKVKCPSCKKLATPVVLPPGENKSREEGAFHDLVYSEAQRILGRSDTWLIVGYSFPEYDRDVSDLLRAAIQRQPVSGKNRCIWVLNPESTVVTRRIAKAIGGAEQLPDSLPRLGTDKLLSRESH
jgi:hypothetical protein